jgi:hypothetical protein
MSNFSKEKMDLYTYYLSHYNTTDMLNFCKIALNKHRFENYRMTGSADIHQDDMIVNDNNIRDYIQNIIIQNYCSDEDFKTVFGMLSVDDIYYIGI